MTFLNPDGLPTVLNATISDCVAAGVMRINWSSLSLNSSADKWWPRCVIGVVRGGFVGCRGSFSMFSVFVSSRA
jgi:hypothetical protein